METPSDWEDRLARWQNELELFEQLDETPWVTLAKAEAETGVSRSALRSWYRNGEIQSRLVDGPNGPQRLVQLDAADPTCAPVFDRPYGRVLVHESIARDRVQHDVVSKAYASGFVTGQQAESHEWDSQAAIPHLGSEFVHRPLVKRVAIVVVQAVGG